MVNDLPGVPHCPNCLHTLTILTCELHVTFMHWHSRASGLHAAFKFVPVFSSDLRGIKGGYGGAFQHQNSSIASVQPTHYTITPMDFFVDLFTITSNNPEAEPAPSAPVDAGGGNGGCIVA